MSTVFVTGSTTGLGRATAEQLLDTGHQVVLHARSAERAGEFGDLAERATGIAIGDLANADDVRSVAEQANTFGRVRCSDPQRRRVPGGPTRGDGRRTRPGPRGQRAGAVHADRADAPAQRLVYLSSMMHTLGSPSLDDVEWTTRPWHAAQAYGDSKLLLAAFANAIARRWPDVCSSAVDPDGCRLGWAVRAPPTTCHSAM